MAWLLDYAPTIPGIIAIYLTGSRAAGRERPPVSDWDLIALTRFPVVGFDVRREFGLHVDLGSRVKLPPGLALVKIWPHDLDSAQVNNDASSEE